MLRSMTRTSPGLAFGPMATAGIVLAAGPFDGFYRGTRHETKNSNSGYCRNVNNDQTQLAVTDSVAKYAWGGTMEAPVKPDGTFQVTTEGWRNGLPFELKGNIVGGNLEADVGNNTCRGHLSLKKS